MLRCVKHICHLQLFWWYDDFVTWHLNVIDWLTDQRWIWTSESAFSSSDDWRSQSWCRTTAPPRTCMVGNLLLTGWTLILCQSIWYWFWLMIFIIIDTDHWLLFRFDFHFVIINKFHENSQAAIKKMSSQKLIGSLVKIETNEECVFIKWWRWWWWRTN